jgi:hypothetical protein
MPKVGNKTFPYTSKGIDDAKKEKKRIASGGTAKKRKPKMIGDMWVEPPSVNGRTLERRPVDPNRVKPKPMPRMPRDPNRTGPAEMPRKIRPRRMPVGVAPKPVRPKNGPTFGAVPKPARRRPVRTSPMKREK